MVGNKHKNGIICTFPGCEKTMRTQKFKIHFTKAHLKQGEVYSVEHRRRYEVAREDGPSNDPPPSGGGGGGTGSAPELPADLSAVDKIKPDATISPHPGALQSLPPQPQPAPVPSNPAPEPTRRDDVGTNMAELAAQAVGHSSELINDARAAADMAWALSKQQEAPQVQPSAPPVATYEAPPSPSPAQASQPLRSPESSNSLKRPASAMEEPAAAETPSAASVDPSNTLLVEFVALMDRRFQELVGKMGEMIDVQKELIDALKGSSPPALSLQAPALALASAAEAVMKKRKAANGTGSAVV